MDGLDVRMNETQISIKEVLTNDKYDRNAKLQVIRKLKDIFKPPDKIFSRVRLEVLLQNLSLENKTIDKDFLFSYGVSLVNFLGKDQTISSEIFHQLEHVLEELKKHDENLTSRLSNMLWNFLEGESIIHPGGILCGSKHTIENMVLDWIDTVGNPQLNFSARMAAASPELFQSFTAVLYEILVKARGHKKVLEVTNFFISAVMTVCGKEGKDFLALYPKDCRQLVSLLMIDPQVFYEEQKVTAEQVNLLLSEMFFTDKNKALILLSHYSAWVSPFKQFLNESSV